MFREIREELIWADGGAVKKATDAAILSLLGPKTEADQQAAKKKPAKKVGRYCPMHLIVLKYVSPVMGCMPAQVLSVILHHT